jgi:glycerate 2-kinase
MTPLARVARSMFASAVEAVRPAALLRRVGFSPDGVTVGDRELRPAGRLVLVALGKAAPGFSFQFLRSSERIPDVTFVLAPHGVDAPADVQPFLRRGAHPVPDAGGEQATTDLLELLAGLDASDGVVLLLSGGASALLARPLPGVARERVAEVTKALLLAGAPIHELNAVRKHLLAAAGGRLAAACPARILTLALSDVPGDDFATIASGPTVADPTTFADAVAALHRRGLAQRFPDITSYLSAHLGRDEAESPKPDDPRLRRSCARLLGSNRDALEGAAAAARREGFRTAVLTRTLRGEARVVGDALAALAAASNPGDPLALLAAGETTVTVTGEGCGGRNLELALAAACALADVPDRCLLAGGSDGIDGTAPAAGAVVDGATLARGAVRGRDAAAALQRNDSWGFFEDSAEAILTGPTGTNVADLIFLLVAGGTRAFLGAPASLGEQISLASRSIPNLRHQPG